MAKYEPLVRYLRRQKASEVELSFCDIERIVGLLPKASNDLLWWRAEDAASAQPQQRAFAQSGFTPKPELRAERVRFIRAVLAADKGMGARPNSSGGREAGTAVVAE